MPVNTAALKTFAPAMRRQLLEAVGRKLDLLLNSQTPDTLSTYAKQIAELREQEEENREQLLERVAYTWFNRLCALRYLDAKGWHPFGCKVLMPAAEGETQPELLKLMRAGSLPAELNSHTNEARLHGLLDGQIPPAIAGGDPQGEVYRELVLTSCRSYHQLLPELFEGLDDASELLLPDDLLSEGSIVGTFRSAISDKDCEDVEIIGWLYQFYISEKKDQVIGKVVKSEDIPAATQLFTPNWIVKYMVQNSLGAHWLASNPDSKLNEQMKYYIEPTEQSEVAKAQLEAFSPKIVNPEEIKLIDPACGSGHILVEAYEVLKEIYKERGYQAREIPRLILERNLFGIDIDERAVQSATFALMMKGRADDRHILERNFKLNVTSLVDSDRFNPQDMRDDARIQGLGIEVDDLTELKRLFKHAKTFGTLIEVPLGLAEKLPALRSLSELRCLSMVQKDAQNRLGRLVRQAEFLIAKYHFVIANPPYMGSKGMNADLKKFAREKFPDAYADLFSCFMKRSYSLAHTSGYVSMVTMQSWMFLGTFARLRKAVIDSRTICSLLHIGYNSFPSLNSKIAQACAFVMRNVNVCQYLGSYVDLNSAEPSADKDKVFLKRDNSLEFAVDQNNFERIPGNPIAFWLSPEESNAFYSNRANGDLCVTSNGVQTGNNDAYVREWYEVSLARIGQRWFPYNKGGPYKKWFGNAGTVVDWEFEGARIKSQPNSCCRGEENFKKACITWTDVTWRASARYLPEGFISDAAGPCAMFHDEEDALFALGVFNTPLADRWTRVLNPTLHFQAGDFKKIPFPGSYRSERARSLVQEAIAITKHDLKSSEVFIDFEHSPLLFKNCESTNFLHARMDEHVDTSRKRVSLLREIEEENLGLVVNSFGIANTGLHSILDEWITLLANPAYRYGGDLAEEEKWIRFCRDTIAEFTSYATGCMMGRYSLEQPGLILADSRDSQAEQLTAYEDKVGKSTSEVQFKPDPDGIIPVLDGEWFEDDIVARTHEFLGVTFPESSVAENLRFIEVSLGKDIRKYFCTEFYKDHLQTYKKRPIYWMVQSPKKGFACLIYLHRYTKDTLNQVLNNYFRPYLQKLEAHLAQLGLDQLNDDLPTRERTAARKEAEKITKVLKECQAWEQDALLPLAQQRIELDLDDGVKVNYLKLQDVLATIPGLAAKED